jgi:transcriptional regulator with XRE-family HTH domain
MSRLNGRKRVMEDFTANVRALLRITGWSQARLARQLEIDAATVTNWLKKKTAPDGTARYAIKDLLRRAKEGEFKEPAALASA